MFALLLSLDWLSDDFWVPVLGAVTGIEEATLEISIGKIPVVADDIASRGGNGR